MKAIINPQDLSKELKKMSLVVKKHPILPITSCALFDFKNNKVVITTTDLETNYTISMDCICGDEFSFCLDYFDISQISATVFDTLEIERKDKELTLKSGKAKFKLSVIGEKVDFPLIEKEQDVYDLNVNGDFFFHLSLANTCKSKESMKVSLNMAGIRVFKTFYEVVGCDGFVLYKKKFFNDNKNEFVAMVADKFVSLCKTFQETKLSFGERFVQAETENEIIISRLSEAKYANIDVIVPLELNSNILLSKQELRNALNVVSTGNNSISKQFIFNFKPNQVLLSSQDVDFNKQSETVIDVEHKVEIEQICLNSSQLLHLTSLINQEEIKMTFNHPQKSVYIQPSGDDSVFILIQPLFEINS